MHKTFHIYKSSAGSGKTYTLVKEYLKIVLQHPSRVRNILAITFTNAAAAEMKSRILEELAMISSLESNPGNEKGQAYLDALHRELSLEANGQGIYPRQQYIRNAAEVLRFILHNYSDFAVSTIDSFVHRIIRTFAFDLQLPLNFEVELDADALLEQAVELLISRAGHDPQLTRVLLAFIERQTDNEKDLRIETLITRLARTLMDEEGTVWVEKLKELSLEDFLSMIGVLQHEVASFENQVKGLAAKAMTLIENHNIPAAAFSRGTTGIHQYFLQLSRGMVAQKITPNNYVRATIEEDKWCSAKASLEDKLNIEAISGRLSDIYHQIHNGSLQRYFLCQAVNQNIFPLAVLNETAKVLQEVKEENILLHISDFNKKIASIIEGEPVPFIYERIGERYQHYMIDEFQDTSTLQWQNLLPLVDNSLASGHSSLVVGDGKQAIYRWRSGDVQQFASLPLVPQSIRAANRESWQASLVRNHQVRNLDTNYRSRQQIIGFNNAFFENARQLLPAHLAPIYEQISQKSLDSKTGGYAEICFTREGHEDGQEQQTLDKIVQTISQLRNAGHPLSDITILCRANREGSLVARHLLENQISVISSESLLLSQSPEVCFMCSVLRLAINRNDKVAAVEILGYLFKKKRLSADSGFHQLMQQAGLFASRDANNPNPARSLEILLEQQQLQWSFAGLLSQNIYDACETIIRVFFPQLSPPDPFLAFFMDAVFEYSEKFNPGIEDFLDWWQKEHHNFSLELPAGLNAVQVMTIHRSKGLQFPVVIYPFAQPHNSRQTKDGQWASLQLDAIPHLPATWVTLSGNGTRNTPFEPLHQAEKDMSFLDLLNIIYVAFTRPQDKLFVISGPVSRDKHGQPNADPCSVNGMLCSFLQQQGLWQNDQHIYSFGSFEPPAPKPGDTIPPENDFFTNYLSAPWHRAIRLKSNQTQRSQEPNHLEKGNLLHRIMEGIHTRQDVEKLLQAMLTNGEIDQAIKEEWTTKLKQLLSDPLLQECFLTPMNAKTEPGIFDAGGSFYRPDRVELLPHKTFIIDYKTGKEYPRHEQQMENYARLLQQMGYPHIQKIIVYLDQAKVKRV